MFEQVVHWVKKNSRKISAEFQQDLKKHFFPTEHTRSVCQHQVTTDVITCGKYIAHLSQQLSQLMPIMVSAKRPLTADVPDKAPLILGQRKKGGNDV